MSMVKSMMEFFIGKLLYFRSFRPLKVRKNPENVWFIKNGSGFLERFNV